MNEATTVAPAAVADPRRLVTDASFALLVDAVVGDDPATFATIHDDVEGVRFRCLRCGHLDHNGPTAKVVDGWRWSCGACRHTGTRIAFERVILEDAIVMSRFYALLRESS